MAKLVTVAEMHAIEKAADAAGHSYSRMMEQAGKSVANAVLAHSHERNKSALALVGTGNNGGDALVALTTLASKGWSVSALVVGDRGNNDHVLKEAINQGVKIAGADDGSNMVDLIEKHDVVLDGLLGTGVRLPLRPTIAQELRTVGKVLDSVAKRPLIVAVDCPSGMDCDSGEVAPETLKANLTVTMAAVKKAMLTLPAFEYLGELKVGDIGVPDDLPEWTAIERFAVDEAMARAALPPRPLDAHKGTFGTALIVAGSRRFPGAALLAGKAAYRSGAGLVTIATAESMQRGLVGQLPEATWLPLTETDGWISAKAATQVKKGLERVTALLLGPGLGQETETSEFTRKLLKADLPAMVVDADGLKLLAKINNWAKQLPKDSVLTPHPGEMSILTNLARERFQAARLETAEKFAKSWKHVVVLKGAFTVIAAPDGRSAVLPLATPALARAGTGDVLAGIIAGLRAQGVPAFEAACAGAWLHGQAGLRAATRLEGTAGVLAGDLVEEIPGLMGK